MKSISAKFLIGWGLSLGSMVSCEVGMLCAGYLGANSGQLLLFLRFAAVLAALFLFAASVAFFRERMRPWVISIGLCVCMVEIADFAVLRGQRSTFFLGIKSRLKATLDPDAVQAWAVPLIEKSDPSSIIYIP